MFSNKDRIAERQCKATNNQTKGWYSIPQLILEKITIIKYIPNPAKRKYNLFLLK